MQAQQAPQHNWPEHITRWQDSKLTRNEYCLLHDLKFHTFVYQIKRHRKIQTRPITLVPIRVRATSAPQDLLLQGPNGWSLMLGAGTSASWLAELMGQLS